MTWGRDGERERGRDLNPPPSLMIVKSKNKTKQETGISCYCIQANLVFFEKETGWREKKVVLREEEGDGRGKEGCISILKLYVCTLRLRRRRRNLIISTENKKSNMTVTTTIITLSLDSSLDSSHPAVHSPHINSWGWNWSDFTCILNAVG